MPLHLPIADMSVDLWAIILLSGSVGVISGLFGIGGGFLLTPLLMMMGIPPTVAVGSGAAQILSVSVSGVITYWRQNSVDVLMGLMLSGGGLIGSIIGIAIFRWLDMIGQIDLIIALCYVCFLGGIGGFMLMESLRPEQYGTAFNRPRFHGWLLQSLPFKIRFRTSQLYISMLIPTILGMIVGIMTAIMGIGGGFIMIPAMIYILTMPTRVVIGTSLFQIVFVSAATTMLHAAVNMSVDLMLVLLLAIGGATGMQIGARLSDKIPAKRLRLLLAVLVLAVCIKVVVDVLQTATDLFTLASISRPS